MSKWNRNAYDRSVLRNPEATIEHLWGWGEARRVLGWQPVRCMVSYQSGQQLNFTLMIKQLPLLHLQIGVMHSSPPFALTDETLPRFLDELRKVASEKHRIIAIAIAGSRLKEESPGYSDLFYQHGLRPSQLIQHRRKTIVVNLKQDENKIFQKMSSSTRRYIRKGIRSGLSVRKARTINDLKLFFEIYSDMCREKGLFAFSFEFFRTMWNELGTRWHISLFLVCDGLYVLGGTLVACDQQAYRLLFSSHRRSGPNLGASRLLEWEIIKEAKKQSKTYYDLGGIPFDTPEDRSKLCGVARWKAAFGGRFQEYVESFDLVINPSMYGVLQKIKIPKWYEIIKRHCGIRL